MKYFIEPRERLYQDMLDWAYEIGSTHKIDPKRAKEESSNFRNFLARMQKNFLIFEEESAFLKEYLKKQIAESDEKTLEERQRAHSRLSARFSEHQFTALRDYVLWSVAYSKDSTLEDVEAKTKELTEFIGMLKAFGFINQEQFVEVDQYIKEERARALYYLKYISNRA